MSRRPAAGPYAVVSNRGSVVARHRTLRAAERDCDAYNAGAYHDTRYTVRDRDGEFVSAPLAARALRNRRAVAA